MVDEKQASDYVADFVNPTKQATEKHLKLLSMLPFKLKKRYFRLRK